MRLENPSPPVRGGREVRHRSSLINPLTTRTEYGKTAVDCRNYLQTSTMPNLNTSQDKRKIWWRGGGKCDVKEQAPAFDLRIICSKLRAFQTLITIPGWRSLSLSKGNESSRICNYKSANTEHINNGDWFTDCSRLRAFHAWTIQA
jgi:hypothetical protein